MKGSLAAWGVTRFKVCLAGLLLGAALFHFSEDGLHVLSIGSFVLMIVSIIALTLSESEDQRAGYEPFAAALGLKVDESAVVFTSSRVDFSGRIDGRPVKVRIQTSRRSRSAGSQTTLTISMECANPRRIRLRVVPVLSRFDCYLEWLPPKLEGPWPWSDGFEVRGAPADAARGLVQRVESKYWGNLSVRGRGGDSVTLSGGRCSWTMQSWDREPSAPEVKARLALLSAIAAAAG